MPEIVGTFARTELWDERANCSGEARNSSRRDLAEERLEFAVRQFDWIEVGRVFRQVAQRRVRFLNRLANGGPHVDAAVIHHDDVVAPERGNQALLDISEEHLSSHGTFDHHWGGHFIVAQGSHEGDRLPCSKRNGADHPVAPRSTPPDPRQVCADRGLVNKHQPGGIKHTLLSDPTSACSRHIRSLPFGSLQAFFKGDSVAIEKTPERATAGSNPSLAQLCDGLYQSQVRLLGNQIEYLLRKLFQRRNASSTRLRRSALAFVPALQPLYRRTHAHLETFSRLAPRRTTFNSFDDAFTQITRIGPRHRPPPQRRINARRLAHP